MDEELISKKELLDRYGISYGALYRWKRMGLIPESWFLRKATVTGQETFFRRDQICPRVKLILEKKEKVSLEQLAQSFQQTHRQAAATRKLKIRENGREYIFSLDKVQEIVLISQDKEEDLLNYLKEEVVL